ncbi:NAD(P)-dependent oxidoreductase [Kitasatospora indigofera]|uniref:NAD(P)-dependent oxidoreductase n=1 Tax=Kitasatospora indigofera TaxID=67307 RepID=UPI0036ADF5A5
MNHHPAASPVTVIGLGPMGRALAGAFLRAGHRTTVWNRTAGKADDLPALGAVVAGDAAEAVAASPLVVVSLLDQDAVQAVLGPLAGSLAGRTVLNLTSDSPARARTCAAWAAGHGIDYLDGAVMVPADVVGGPRGLVLYSGPEALHLAHREALASLGGTAAYLGPDPGRAAAHDVALLDIFWTAMSGVVHGFALAAAENVPATALLPYAQGIGGLLPGIMEDFARQIDAGAFPGAGSNLSSAAAGMVHIVEAAKARGMDVTVLTAAHALARQAVEAGHGTEGFARLTQVVRGRPDEAVVAAGRA